MLKIRFTALALLVAILGALVLAPARPTAAAPSPFQDIPVVGTIAGGGTFTGTLDVTRFRAQNGALTAVGSLSGTLTDALGGVIGTVTNVPVALPVVLPSATCEILDLELGPLDLNLLGLVVHLDRINLEITAVQAPGNLLGNLLCAVANLLNGSSPLQGLVNLLNQIIRLF